MSLARATGVILAKELRTEFRSRELLGTTLVFVLIVIVLVQFHVQSNIHRNRAASVPAFCGWHFYLPAR